MSNPKFSQVQSLALVMFIIAAPFVILARLFWYDAVPHGRFTVHHVVGEASPFIDRLLPESRIQTVTSSDAGDFQKMVDEPVYASIHLPGEFDHLTVDLSFKTKNQPIVEAGLLINDEPLQYDLQPLQNSLIDYSGWERVEQNGVTFLQRAKMYGSLEDFLVDPPDRQSIATYHYALSQPYRLVGYQPLNQLTTTNVSLRGYHEYVTYIKNEPLLLQVNYMDMNREYGEDPVEVLVFNEQGTMVASQQAEDDGVIEATAQGSHVQTIVLTKNELPEGVYKVILKANRDVFFRQLMTRQRYMTFVGPVYIGDEAGYRDTPTPVRFWTDAKHLSFFTYHADAAQQVAIGKEFLDLPEAQTRYEHTVTESGLVAVTTKAGDFTFTQDGKLAFSRDQFFNPDPVALSWNTDLDALGINFIIANYVSPKQEGEWTHVSATFDLSRALRTGDDIKLVVAAPGIKSLQASVDIHTVGLTFIRPPLSFSQLVGKIKTFLHL